MDKKLYSVSEFAALTSLSNKTIYRKVLRGDIPSVRVGSQVRIPAWYLHDLTYRPGELPIWLRKEVNI